MPPLPVQSPYELLEVAPGATSQDIEGAYKRVSGMVAADSLAVYAMLDDADTDHLRAQVEAAYHTLRDPARRAAYDAAQARSNATSPSSAGPSATSRQSLRPVPISNLQLPEPTAPAASASPLRFHAPALDDQKVAEPAPELPPQPAVRNAAGPAPGPAAVAPTRRPNAQPAHGRRPLRPALAIEWTEDLEVNGALLRRLRESAQASLEEVCEVTKISRRYLMAVEADDCANLPANVYVRGFVSEYARVLGLDSRQVAKSYMAQYLRHRAQSGE
jgi:hypothetical protein